jgi:hypothetical protein
MRFTVEMDMNAARGMEADILRELASYMLTTLNATIPFITTKISREVEQAIESSSTVAAINGGELEDLLCITNPASTLRGIIDTVLASLRIDRSPVITSVSGIKGGYTINLLDDSYTDVLSAGNVSYITQNGFPVPWLEWLLLRGTTPLRYKARLLKTNRGGVILIGDDDDLAIPVGYAGTSGDNFLTRALLPLEPKIGQIIEEEVSRRS